MSAKSVANGWRSATARSYAGIVEGFEIVAIRDPEPYHLPLIANHIG
jgi:hypothetical protein